MTAHSKIYSHTTEQNEIRSNTAPQLSSRFWKNCARMLSVIAISAAATGSAYAITAADDTAPEVGATFATTPYTTARVAGVDSVALQFPAPTGALGTVHYSIVGSSLTTAQGGTISGAAKFEATSQTGVSSGFSASNAPTAATLTYTPALGFVGNDPIAYRVYDVSATGGTALVVGTGTLTIVVNPAVTEAPANGTTTTLTTSSGSGVLQVAGLGEVTMAGNPSAHTGTGGVVIDGGTLNTPGWSGAVPVAGRHGAVMNASASLTITKLIIG